MADRPIRVVLDTSAIVAYTRGSIDVGEIIAEINDEHGVAALPAACLAAAVPAVADRARLDLLVAHTAAEVLADEPGAWLALATTTGIVGRPDAASAAIAATEFGVHLLSAQPGLYAGLADDIVIPIDGTETDVHSRANWDLRPRPSAGPRMHQTGP